MIPRCAASHEGDPWKRRRIGDGPWVTPDRRRIGEGRDSLAVAGAEWPRARYLLGFNRRFRVASAPDATTAAAANANPISQTASRPRSHGLEPWSFVTVGGRVGPAAETPVVASSLPGSGSRWFEATTPTVLVIAPDWPTRTVIVRVAELPLAHVADGPGLGVRVV